MPLLKKKYDEANIKYQYGCDEPACDAITENAHNDFGKDVDITVRWWHTDVRGEHTGPTLFFCPIHKEYGEHFSGGRPLL